ncbi:MAG TPA: DUF2207 domain-containing protein [Candidatus Parcubacteria bacterium]|nr:DUF2207 domain-containing protein [Candidatus Parcubacteria bacterium]
MFSRPAILKGIGILILLNFIIPSFSLASYQPASSFSPSSFSSSPPVSSSLSSERIESFDAQIDLQKDGSFWVKERIVYNFGTSFKHGIYRIIPVNKIRISKIKVFDDNNKPYPFKVENKFYSLRIKIGNPNKLLKGRHIYNILYKVDRAVLFFKDHDEIYWNVTGDKWPVTIEKATLTLNLPRVVNPARLNLKCFTGVYGSTEGRCAFFVTDSKKITFQRLENLSPNHGLTIVAGLPKGLIRIPFYRKLWRWLQDYGVFLIPLAVLIFLFGQWCEKGRDRKIKKSIVVQYEPPDNLRPMEIQAILGESIDNKSLAATLVDLAVRGFLKIKDIKKRGIFSSSKSYKLIKLKEYKDSSEILDYEKEFLNQLFGGKESVRLSSLRGSGKLAELTDSVLGVCLQGLVDKGYFPKDSKKTHWSLYGIIIIFIGALFSGVAFGILIESLFALLWAFFLIIFFRGLFAKRALFKEKLISISKTKTEGSTLESGGIIIYLNYLVFFLFLIIPVFIALFFRNANLRYLFGLRLMASLIISGLLFKVFDYFMVKRTEKGIEARWKALGFGEFIRTAEKYRAQFYEKENIFEEYLPYAIVFGLTGKWAKAFEDIYQDPPSWYDSPLADSFSVAAFSNSLSHNLSSSFSSSGGVSSGRSGFSSGGGFSGGGFGGGGGGSW